MILTPALATLIAASAGHAAAASDFTRHQVAFPSGDAQLAGNLYLPDGYEPSDRLPTVIVTGAWTTVKEQMPAVYAAEMAGRGFAVLTFDFRGWGESEGSPRFLEDPERKTQDIIAAASFLVQRPEVDPARVAGLGICASAAYMSDATRRSPDIRALGLVAPWFHDRAIAEAVYGGVEGMTSLIATGRDAAESPDPVYIEAASSENPDALMYQAPYYTDTNRGMIDAYDNRFNVASWEPWLTYDGVEIGETLRKPTVAVHSEAAAVPQGVAAFAERMGHSAELVWLDGVTQFDFYDNPEPVGRAADILAAHFDEAFAEQQAVAAVKTRIEAVMTLVDLGSFGSLPDLYADAVSLDFSSLTGQPPVVLSGVEIAELWGATLPGFDRTRHAISELHVEIDGNTATATADVQADHYLGADFWRVSGAYRFELRETSGEWRITSHALDVRDEAGSRDVLARATERVSEGR
ncbi:MAG: nuclear transport factor 2 family protein [Planctomycetota bacterium]